MTTPTATAGKLGLIAGGGALPGVIARACRDDRRAHFILGLCEFASAADLGREPDAWIRIGQARRGFALLAAANVREVVMAGHVRRPTWGTLWPDWRTALFYVRLGLRALGDDALLTAVIGEIEREGFRVVGVDDICPALLAPEGALGQRTPDAAAMRQIALGVGAALDLGRWDLGQAVVVADGAVVDRENALGTDALLARVAASGRGRGGVLVKTKKPQQDRRVDLPAIGIDTVRNAAAAGLAGIAIEAGHCLIVERAAVAAAADAAGLFVVGVTAATAMGPRA
jgi:hypothetical protein